MAKIIGVVTQEMMQEAAETQRRCDEYIDKTYKGQDAEVMKAGTRIHIQEFCDTVRDYDRAMCIKRIALADKIPHFTIDIGGEQLCFNEESWYRLASAFVDMLAQEHENLIEELGNKGIDISELLIEDPDPEVDHA